MTRSNRHAGPTVAEETLDQALDALVRGDYRGFDQIRDMDPDLAESTADVFRLAERSGFSRIDLGPDTILAEWENKPTPLRRRIVTTFGAVAATIALAVGLASALPGVLPDDDGHTPTLAALDAPPSLDGATQPAINPEPTTAVDSLNAEPTATADPSNPGQATGSSAPLSPDDCTVEPRTREEVLDILSTAPGDDPPSPGGRDVLASDIPVAELNQVYREWQACTRYGTTLQTMALETPALIRTDIYGTWDAIERMPNVVPYSEPTLNEIIDGRESIDAAEIADYQAYGYFPVSMLQIDESEPVIVSDDGSYITVDTVKINPGSDTRYPRDVIYISFQLVDGQWLIADMDSIQLD